MNQAISYTPNGQPAQVGRRQYTWDALERLTSVKQDTQTIAQYQYNHRGERIGKQLGNQTTSYLYEAGQLTAELNKDGQITRQYLYLADQPIAVIDTPEGKQLSKAELSAPESLGLDAKNIINYWLETLTNTANSSSSEQISYLHTNHLGAPEAATDKQGQVIWQASYAPFGAASININKQNVASNFDLYLRLPGQYLDAETGLHYNRQRYYDPARGEYLTPDPPGTRDGPNPYSYVRYNPLRYIDPEGLVLFAFDGTNNDERNPNTLSNVVRFRDLYQSDKAQNFYITGPGTTDPRSGISGGGYDTLNSSTGKARITRLIKDLDTYSDDVDDDTAVDIDVVGFSRGAAQARDFAKQVVGKVDGKGYYKYTVKQDGKDTAKCQKLNFRFMGLWDTVLSTHSGSYQLRIPDTFSYVAHAIALNEYRGLFPSESILGVQASNDRTRIERGFLGSHSDIGGSFEDGDLARVAMVWMRDQAVAAGVSTGHPVRTIIANPILHDKSSNLYASTGPAPTQSSEDRVSNSMDGTSIRQRRKVINGMSYADTQEPGLINYTTRPRDNIAGTVNMNLYLKWLNDHNYNLNITVQ